MWRWDGSGPDHQIEADTERTTLDINRLVL